MPLYQRQYVIVGFWVRASSNEPRIFEWRKKWMTRYPPSFRIKVTVDTKFVFTGFLLIRIITNLPILTSG
jgi:hypothetical protein